MLAEVGADEARILRRDLKLRFANAAAVKLPVRMARKVIAAHEKSGHDNLSATIRNLIDLVLQCHFLLASPLHRPYGQNSGR